MVFISRAGSSLIDFGNWTGKLADLQNYKYDEPDRLIDNREMTGLTKQTEGLTDGRTKSPIKQSSLKTSMTSFFAVVFRVEEVILKDSHRKSF